MRRHGRIRGHSSRDRRRIPPRRRGGRPPNSEGPRSPVDRPRLYRPCRPRGRAHPRPNRGRRVGPARIRRALVLRHLLRRPALRRGWIPCEAFPTPPVPRRRRSLRIPRGPTFRIGCVPVAGPPRIVFDARDDPRVETFWRVTFPFSLVVWVDAAILFLAVPLGLLLLNAARGDRAFPQALLGYRARLDPFPPHAWLMEKISASGDHVLVLFPKRGGNPAQDLERLRAAGIDRAWVTPQIPFMVPLCGGFLLAFFVGNVLLGFLRLVG